MPLSAMENRLLDLIGKSESVTIDDMVTKLFDVKGSQFVSIVTETVPKMRKTGNPYAETAVKVNKYRGIVNFHYDEGVLRRLAKEGKSPDDFKRGESWHEPVLHDGKLTPFCRHKKTDKLYLRFMYQGADEPTYFNRETGLQIPTDALAPFLPEREAYGNQGLDDPLKFLVFGLDSILAINVAGESLRVKG